MVLNYSQGQALTSVTTGTEDYWKVGATAEDTPYTENGIVVGVVHEIWVAQSSGSITVDPSRTCVDEAGTIYMAKIGPRPRNIVKRK